MKQPNLMLHMIMRWRKQNFVLPKILYYENKLIPTNLFLLLPIMIKIKGISKTGARPENKRLVLLSIVAIKIMQHVWF